MVFFELNTFDLVLQNIKNEQVEDSSQMHETVTQVLSHPKTRCGFPRGWPRLG